MFLRKNDRKCISNHLFSSQLSEMISNETVIITKRVIKESINVGSSIETEELYRYLKNILNITFVFNPFKTFIH